MRTDPTPPLLGSIKRALGQTLPGEKAQSRMAPDPLAASQAKRTVPARESAVLLLLYPTPKGLGILLTERSQHVGHHKGQVSLPGGQKELGDETLWHTALRESWEETGVETQAVEHLGALSPMYIAGSHFCVQPFVGSTALRGAWRPHPPEVAALLEMPLERLVDDGIKRTVQWPWPQGARRVPYYALDGRMIWGATAMILSEFEVLLRGIISDRGARGRNPSQAPAYRRSETERE